MEQNETFTRLLALVTEAYESHPQAREFAPFPTDLTAQPVTHVPVPAADLLQQEQGFTKEYHSGLVEAIRAAGGMAHWLEHYRGTALGDEFVDRFGCFPIIGPGGAFHSAHLRCWMVYMPVGLHYPWHEHQAEEIYLLVAGRAKFSAFGSADHDLEAGEVVFHAANQPHATRTGSDPVLCLVFWRADFDSPLVLSSLQ